LICSFMVFLLNPSRLSSLRRSKIESLEVISVFFPKNTIFLTVERSG